MTKRSGGRAVTLARADPPFSLMVSSGRRDRRTAVALEGLSIYSTDNFSSDGSGEPSPSRTPRGH